MELEERIQIERFKSRLRGSSGARDAMGKVGQHLSTEAINDDDFIVRMMELEAEMKADRRHIQIDTLAQLAAICKINNSEKEFIEAVFSGELTLDLSKPLQTFYEMGSQLWTKIPQLTSKFRYRTNPVKSKDGKLSLVKLDWNTPDRSSKLYMLGASKEMFLGHSQYQWEKIKDEACKYSEVVIVDISWSMIAGGSLALAQMYLLNRLEYALANQLEFQVILFNDQVRHCEFVDSNGNKTFNVTKDIDVEMFKSWVWRLNVYGTTILQPALDYAAGLKASTGKTVSEITVFTDDGSHCTIPANYRGKFNALVTHRNDSLQKVVRSRNGYFEHVASVFNLLQS